jgi:2-oxo-3-hexenedioate decarboxylase
VRAERSLWQRLGLDRPIRARIYEQTLCADDLDTAGLVDPRIEPEIVVGFGAAVAQGSGINALAAAVEWVAAGLEVVQCHFTGWELTPAEAVADGGLHAALAIGPRTPANARALQGLAAVRCELLRDGALVETGRGADVLGGPLHALKWVLRELPGGVRAGEIVTTGTLTRAVPIAPGEVWEHRLGAEIGVEPVTLRLRPLAAAR